MIQIRAKKYSVLFCLFVGLSVNVVAKKDAIKWPITRPEVTVSTPYGPIVLRDVELSRGSGSSPDITVKGTVTNQTDRNWERIYLQFHLADKSGQELHSNYLGGKWDAQSMEFAVFNFGKGNTKQIADILGTSALKLNLTQFPIDKVAGFTIDWIPAYSNLAIKYVLSLTSPAVSGTLAYEDQSLSISFTPGDKQLEFSLRNKTDEPITINWDEVSFVAPDGSSSRVIHKGVKLIDRGKSQSPSFIPPSARIDDLIVPVDKIQYDDNIHDWEYDSLLPKKAEAAQLLKSKTFGVFMPLVINGTRKSYSFKFHVDDVTN